MAKTDVLIVGAGPTGLVLALWLARLGIRPRVVDKAAEQGTTSRAVGVQARTLEQYRQLGLDAQVVRAGFPARGLNLWVRGDDAPTRLFSKATKRSASLSPSAWCTPPIVPSNFSLRTGPSRLESGPGSCRRP